MGIIKYTEEEKKAIENIKDEFHINGVGARYIELKSEDLEILLSLLEKQQKEIDDLYIKLDDKKIEIQHLEDDLKYSDKRIFYLEIEARKIIEQNIDKEKINIYENYISKDKIIEKIKEIEDSLKEDCIALHEFQRLAKIDVLKELLGEEHERNKI